MPVIFQLNGHSILMHAMRFELFSGADISVAGLPSAAYFPSLHSNMESVALEIVSVFRNEWSSAIHRECLKVSNPGLFKLMMVDKD